MTCQHLIENNADSPDITLGTVLVVIEGLKWHVNGGPYVIIGIFSDI